MRHKLRQCNVCGQTFVDRAEIAETCFDCRSSESQYLPAPAVGLSAPSVELGSPSVGLSSSSQFVVLGTTAVQLPGPSPADRQQPQPSDNPEPIKLWQQASNGTAPPAKTGWSSPPFKVRFEDHIDSDGPIETLPPPRSRMRARYKLILVAAAVLCYFIWPATPLPTLEDQIARNEPPIIDESTPHEPATAQQPGAAPLEPAAASVDESHPETPDQ